MLYYSKRSVCLGEVFRYTIVVEPSFKGGEKTGYKKLWLRIKNTTSHIFRAGYFKGPYTLYVSVRREDYSVGKPSLDFVPKYCPNLNTGCSFWVELPLVSEESETGTIFEKKGWIVDIISQIVFTKSAKVYFELSLSFSKQKIYWENYFGVVEDKNAWIKVLEQNTKELWLIDRSLREKGVNGDESLKEEVHFVVLTHGLHSNVSADLLYLKERIEMEGRLKGEKLVVSGYNGNVCLTDKGIEYLGKRLAKWVLKEVGWFKNEKPYYQKISFIGHSLGGLIQLYAIGWIWIRTEGKFYDASSHGLIPVNFITLATPWLGLFAENPKYITKALEFGIVGRTGKELGFTMKYDKGACSKHIGETDNHLPLLRTLSLEKSPFRKALKLFKRRTLYSNIINDGIVPLRTSSLFFLDWKNIDCFEKKKKDYNSYRKNSVYSIQMESHEQKNNDESINTSNSSQIEPTISSNVSMQTNATSFSLTMPHIEESCCYSDINKSNSSKVDTTLLDTSKNTEFLNEVESIINPQSSTKEFFIFKPGRTSPSKTYSQSPYLNTMYSYDSISHDYDSLTLTKNNTILDAPETDQTINTSSSSSSSSSFISSFKNYFKHKYGRDDSKVKRDKRNKTISNPKDNDTCSYQKLDFIPKMSFFRSASKVLRPPLPKKDYFINPCRTKTIVHDQYYYPDDILKKFSKFYSKLSIISENGKDSIKRNKVFREKLKLQEKIAKEWHSDMVWRKVLVYLEPDAHNNIVCRRMFVNAYGWPVIEHLASNHFGKISKDESNNKSELEKETYNNNNLIDHTRISDDIFIHNNEV
ncbi:hypothetical protein T552_03510 [Pneumocystis carinii B80]|uniref:DUF676 domain-containing protein n=1 Tax=Pneumocystis carinii (strain B80) TaxID=1408658 RepID=A0A0W4ZB91_PNEC8|nr:hypothetical protein T552_03510 [Pneumocystis carinii B80]KTW25650.1 hypothetical protein T552_03510 [Pneumocystis carinii B80]